MSQKKVDAYKARKGLHNKTDRKEKVLFGLEMFAWAFICVVIVAWIGYSAYVKVTGAKENVVQNTVMDTTALDNYISNLSTDASDGTDSTDADTAEEEDSDSTSFKAAYAENENKTDAEDEKTSILIVEDNNELRHFLWNILSETYTVLEATNGKEGLKYAQQYIPDLIISDVMMPVKDGFECCREVKENPETCSIPFIMLTAKVEDDDIIRGLELGADDYVLKPFTPGILKAKVSNLINGRQTLKQMYTKLFKLPGTDTIAANEQEQTGEEVKTEDPFITAVIKIVEENICEADFSVKKLAAEMNMSQPTLYRKVKQSTDYTIIELIRGVRMRRAGVLLKTKQYAVQEVAEMVGYNDIPTFRKHFVDAFGTTPSTYE